MGRTLNFPAKEKELHDPSPSGAYTGSDTLLTPPRTPPRPALRTVPWSSDSADSGYCTAEFPCTPGRFYSPSLDGTYSESDSGIDDDDVNLPSLDWDLGRDLGRDLDSPLPPQPRKKSSSLPATPKLSQQVQKPARYRHSSPQRRLPGSLRVPDRFIPIRDAGSPLFQKLRTTKPSQLLSPAEKLMRNHRASQDPFAPRQKIDTPPSWSVVQVGGDEDAIPRLGLFAPAGVIFGRHMQGEERRSGLGSVWDVGGITPMFSTTTAVDDGHGRLIQSGTSAPVFSTIFASARRDKTEEGDRHEGRVASALDVDRVCRILNFTSLTPRRRPLGHPSLAMAEPERKVVWDGSSRRRGGRVHEASTPDSHSVLPTAPFKVLDGPRMRDDFYCTILAYSPTCGIMAAALGNQLFGWCEAAGVQLLNGILTQEYWLTSIAFSSVRGGQAILAAGRSNGRLLLMSLLDDTDSPEPRFDLQLRFPIASVSWRPRCVIRPSMHPGLDSAPVRTEELLVGDAAGFIYYYVVEWPSARDFARDQWCGAMTLIVTIEAHSQQVCGLAWTPGGDMFATGGNDNLCCLFEVDTIERVVLERARCRRLFQEWQEQMQAQAEVRAQAEAEAQARAQQQLEEEEEEEGEKVEGGEVEGGEVEGEGEEAGGSLAESASRLDESAKRYWARKDMAAFEEDSREAMTTGEQQVQAGQETPEAQEQQQEQQREQGGDATRPGEQTYMMRSAFDEIYGQPRLTYGTERHRWTHGAAVKAIAFCPWREGLVATGGGFNDKSVHFFHTGSGAALATIAVTAQVTSLVWSTTRREIAATFGYAYPSHPVRIAVFSWPECQLVAEVPWQGEHRALCAIAIPAEAAGLAPSLSSSPALADGCLVVASSEEKLKFHQVWTKSDRRAPVSREGMLGGSTILEGMIGIDKEGDVIR